MGYVPNTERDKLKMLELIGVSSIDDLFSDIPTRLQIHEKPDLPSSLSEIELDFHLKELASKNRTEQCFAGAGSSRHYIPAAVDALASLPQFYTAYTPYQPEVSQGTLTAIFEYQTMICRLTGMDVANASLYDGATSLAEAAFLSSRMTGRRRVVVSDSIHPHYRCVLDTYAGANGLEVKPVRMRNGVFDGDFAGVISDGSVTAVAVQNPDFFGCLADMREIAETVHAKGCHFIYVVTEPLSLGLLKSPGDCGADIVCGEAGSFGNPQGFGGPGLGLLAAKEQFLRKMPGRLAGKTKDADGNDAYVLTLQTREQHIRREKATSNICSNEALCALRAVIYLSLVGNRIRQLAELNHRLASYLATELSGKGIVPLFSAPFFNEFTVKVPSAGKVRAAMKKKGILFGVDPGRWYPEYSDCLILACTECNTPGQIDQLLECLRAHT